MTDKHLFDEDVLTPEEAERILDEDPEKALEDVQRYYREGLIPRHTYERMARFLARRIYGGQAARLNQVNHQKET